MKLKEWRVRSISSRPSSGPVGCRVWIALSWGTVMLTNRTQARYLALRIAVRWWGNGSMLSQPMRGREPGSDDIRL